MVRKKIIRNGLVFPVLTLIIIGFIAFYSNKETIINFALKEESGEREGSFTLKGKASNVIEWNFVSTSTVRLLIIKEVSWNYINDLASQYGDWIKEQMLEDDYVSQGKYKDSGAFYVQTQEIILLKFSSSGSVKYLIKYDPFSIDLMWIFYGLLGIITLIGIIFFITKINKLIHMKIINEKTKSSQAHQTKRNCEHCGIELDSDSIFCHECGSRLKKNS